MLKLVTFTFPRDIDLNLEGSVVAMNYTYVIGKRKEIKTGRIDIVINDGEIGNIDLIGLDGGVLHCHLKIDIRDYRKKDTNTRIKILYEVLFYVFDYLSEKLGWDKSFYDNVQREIVKSDYSPEIVLFKQTKNKSKTHSAEFVLELTTVMADLKLNTYGQAGNLDKIIKVFQSAPDFMLYERFFTKGQWISNDIYSIWDWQKEIFFDCDVRKGSVDIRFEPKDNTIQELNDLLKGLKFDTPDTDRLKLLQLGGSPPKT